MDKLMRLFKIFTAIQANPGISAQDLAFKCDVHVRTIYRDLDALELMTPLQREDRGNGYRFIGNFHLYPLNFTEQETVAISMLPSVVDRDKLPVGFETAHDKIMATHAKEKRQHKNILEDITDMIQMGTPAYRPESPNHLLPIIQAILNQHSIQTTYHTQSRDETTERMIDPYYLVPRDQRFYLIGYCHLKQEVRTFRMSRFLQVEPTLHTFRKGDFNIKQYLKNTWSIERGDKHTTFKVRFAPDVARYIREEELFVHPRMTALPDGGLLFQVTVNNEREFLNWLMQYGASAEILEPVAMRERMKEQLARWAALYS